LLHVAAAVGAGRRAYIGPDAEEVSQRPGTAFAVRPDHPFLGVKQAADGPGVGREMTGVLAHQAGRRCGWDGRVWQAVAPHRSHGRLKVRATAQMPVRSSPSPRAIKPEITRSRSRVEVNMHWPHMSSTPAPSFR